MSIVGTRPPLISETNLYEPHHKVSNPSEESALDMIHAFEAMLAQLDTSIQTQYYVEFEWLAIKN